MSQASSAKNIILTARPFSSKANGLLSQVTRDRYETVSPQDLKGVDASRVEIILLDTARAEELPILSVESLSRFPNLKLIQSTRAGVDVVAFEDLPSQVTICGNIGAYGDQIAEHVFGMILYFARNLGISNLALSKGLWQIPMSTFLRGKTILILGTGGIGESVARLATCFGMQIEGVNTNGRAVPGFDSIVAIDRLEEVLKRADVTVIALPLTVKTFHLIDEKKLRAMKPTCILINVARGYIVEERALYEHLKNAPSFKCGLDVWWHYPKKGEAFAQKFPFLELPNFLGTPHDSGIVPETEEIALLSAIKNIGRYVRGEVLKGVMNRNDYLGLKELIARGT
ncbi:MAG TPA: 2-hydroxyacid dehydrogenase [Nitrososphaerales archaeon]|nr:2-hydroxyacid dehydrogenase [Nitrososphaerales archaeon]